jgi:hypothetical protein
MSKFVMFKPHIYSNMQLDIILYILSRNGFLLFKAQKKITTCMLWSAVFIVG